MFFKRKYYLILLDKISELEWRIDKLERKVLKPTHKTTKKAK